MNKASITGIILLSGLPFAFNACGSGFESAPLHLGSTVSSTDDERNDQTPGDERPPTSSPTATPTLEPDPPAPVVDKPIEVDRSNPRLIESIVDPKLLDSAADKWADMQYAHLDTRVPPVGYLAIYLFGAGTSQPSHHVETYKLIASFGLHVIGPDYAQDYGVTTGCQAGDSACIGNKRLEAITGADHSSLIEVKRANSLEARILKMLTHLEQTQPQYGWGYFLDQNGGIRWDRIVVIGHSHGSGTGPLMAKLHKVARAVALAGPDDVVSDMPSDWTKMASATPADRYYGLTNVHELRIEKYKKSWTALGIDIVGKSEDITDGVAPGSPDIRALYLSTDYGSESANHLSTVPSYAKTRALLTPIYEYLFVP